MIPISSLMDLLYINEYQKHVSCYGPPLMLMYLSNRRTGRSLSRCERSLRPTLKGLRSSSCRCRWMARRRSVSIAWHSGPTRCWHNIRRALYTIAYYSRDCLAQRPHQVLTQHKESIIYLGFPWHTNLCILIHFFNKWPTKQLALRHIGHTKSLHNEFIHSHLLFVSFKSDCLFMTHIFVRIHPGFRLKHK